MCNSYIIIIIRANKRKLGITIAASRDSARKSMLVLYSMSVYDADLAPHCHIYYNIGVYLLYCDNNIIIYI